MELNTNQTKIYNDIKSGKTKFAAHRAQTIRSLEKKCLITVERKENVKYIRAFREVNYHGQYRTIEYQKKSIVPFYVVALVDLK